MISIASIVVMTCWTVTGIQMDPWVVSVLCVVPKKNTTMIMNPMFSSIDKENELSKFLSVADVRRETETAFASTNSTYIDSSTVEQMARRFCGGSDAKWSFSFDNLSSLLNVALDKNRPLNQYWFEKGLIRGHKMASDGMDKTAALMLRAHLMDMVDELDDEARHVTYHARPKYKAPEEIRKQIRQKVNELLGLSEDD